MTEARYNEIVRAGAQLGINVIGTLEADLDEAMIKMHEIEAEASGIKAAQLRGRVRGLAQALATVRSPYSRRDHGQPARYWAQVILGEEAASRLRIKQAARPRVDTKDR